jgi:hypothetical protein
MENTYTVLGIVTSLKTDAGVSTYIYGESNFFCKIHGF